MRKFVIAVVVGAILAAGCSSSGHKATSTTTTTTTGGAAGTTTAGSSTTAHTGTTAKGAPTTAASPTTTKAPASALVTAVSASFVSSNQGFALERSGQVDRTTDGGHTWHRAGTIGRPGSGEIIRFIGPSDGFGFARNSGVLQITHDAGATWSPVSGTPFKTVADLAILRGMIYVVALRQASPVSFRIWSSPVDHLVWKQDPLILPVGAGPVPQEQIVLARGTGWILDVNRTVIAGARLAPSGQWAKWTPPCASYGGAATLTASSSTDLVAICNTGPGTPPSLAMTTTAKFSHDGGGTFASHAIPDAKFGASSVLSPRADTAVIVENGDLRRTTDGGVSWNTVEQFAGPGGAADYGFTTNSQGFVIFNDGRMLMTYDAGATWTPSTRT